MLEAARVNGVSRICVTSTSETYGTAQYVPIDENHPVVGQSPYSATKIGADQLAVSYYRSFGLPVTIVRPFNTYGPRQSARAIIPSIVIQILNGQAPIRVGNLSPLRDFTYVRDTANAFLEINNSEVLRGEVVNIGTNKQISMRHLAELIMGIIGEHRELEVTDERTRPPASEVDSLVCDNSKLLRATNWRPTHRLEQGIGETIHWIRCNMHVFKSGIYNV